MNTSKKLVDEINEKEGSVIVVIWFRRFLQAINFFLDPLVVMLLWNWFLTKVGVPSISYLLAFGISLLVVYVIMDVFFSQSINELEQHNDIEHEVYLLMRALYQTMALTFLIVAAFITVILMAVF